MKKLSLEDMFEIATDQQSVCPPYTPEEYEDLMQQYLLQQKGIEFESSNGERPYGPSFSS